MNFENRRRLLVEKQDFETDEFLSSLLSKFTRKVIFSV